MGYKDACDNQTHKYTDCNSRETYVKKMVFKWQLCKEKFKCSKIELMKRSLRSTFVTVITQRKTE